MKQTPISLWALALARTILDNPVVQPPLPGLFNIPPNVQDIPGRGSGRGHPSPPAPRERATAKRTRIKAAREEAHAQAEHYSLLVKGLTSPSQLRQLCTQRRHLPSGPHHAARFWRTTYERIKTLP